MQYGIFQLLSQPEGVSDREVIDQALWEVDYAEANDYDTVWVTEHHLSEYGFVGVPSVYAAMVAQRTKRLRIGYGVAVASLHHPLRLAEEITWVDQISNGRLWVGLGPGFSEYEFEAFGAPLDTRYEKLDEMVEILRGLMTNETFAYSGRFWQFPPVKLKPRPFQQPMPPLMLASSGEASLERAARQGMPALIGFRPNEELPGRVATYRRIREELGVPAEKIAEEIGQIGVLRRVHVADSDAEALDDVIDPLLWYTATAKRIHRPEKTVQMSEATKQLLATALAAVPQAGHLPDGSVAPQVGSLPDGSAAPKTVDKAAVLKQSEGGMIAGTPDTVFAKLAELQDLGIGHVIAWMNFGTLPYPKVRRSMELLGSEVLPRLRERERVKVKFH